MADCDGEGDGGEGDEDRHDADDRLGDRALGRLGGRRTALEPEPHGAHDEEEDGGERELLAQLEVLLGLADAGRQLLAGQPRHDGSSGTHGEPRHGEPSQRPPQPGNDDDGDQRESRQGEQDDRRMHDEWMNGDPGDEVERAVGRDEAGAWRKGGHRDIKQHFPDICAVNYRIGRSVHVLLTQGAHGRFDYGGAS